MKYAVLGWSVVLWCYFLLKGEGCVMGDGLKRRGERWKSVGWMMGCCVVFLVLATHMIYGTYGTCILTHLLAHPPTQSVSHSLTQSLTYVLPLSLPFSTSTYSYVYYRTYQHLSLPILTLPLSLFSLPFPFPSPPPHFPPSIFLKPQTQTQTPSALR